MNKGLAKIFTGLWSRSNDSSYNIRGVERAEVGAATSSTTVKAEATSTITTRATINASVAEAASSPTSLASFSLVYVSISVFLSLSL